MNSGTMIVAPDSTTAEFCLEGDTAPGGCGGSLTAACSCESNGNEIPAYQAYVLNKGLVNTLVTPDDPLTPEIETTFGFRRLRSSDGTPYETPQPWCRACRQTRREAPSPESEETC